MDNLALKKKLLASIRETKQNMFEAIRQDAERLLEGANTDDELGLQNQMESKKEEMMEDYERDAKQLDYVQHELEVLERISREQVHEEIELGSVIKTNHLNFVIAVTDTNLEVEGEKFVGISEQAPIYQVMKGLKQGQTFTFQDKTYEILEIF